MVLRGFDIFLSKSATQPAPHYVFRIPSRIYSLKLRERRSKRQANPLHTLAAKCFSRREPDKPKPSSTTAPPLTGFVSEPLSPQCHRRFLSKGMPTASSRRDWCRHAQAWLSMPSPRASLPSRRRR